MKSITNSVKLSFLDEDAKSFTIKEESWRSILTVFLTTFLILIFLGQMLIIKPFHYYYHIHIPIISTIITLFIILISSGFFYCFFIDKIKFNEILQIFCAINFFPFSLITIYFIYVESIRSISPPYSDLVLFFDTFLSPLLIFIYLVWVSTVLIEVFHEATKIRKLNLFFFVLLLIIVMAILFFIFILIIIGIATSSM